MKKVLLIAVVLVLGTVAFAQEGEWAGNRFFIGGSTGFTSSNNSGVEPIDSKYSKFGFGLHPGAQFWFTDNWSMASEIGLLVFSLTSTKRNAINDKGEKVEVTDKVSDFGLIGDFSSLKFSLFYHF